MKKLIFILASLCVGLVIGYLVAGAASDKGMASLTESKEDEPLYWVAPMDANFKRDKPGLSPMGMELVPVYADNLAEKEMPGTVRIRSEVVHNLGVKTQAVLFSPLQEQIKAVGYIGFNQDKMMDVHSRISGWVKFVAVGAPGEYVEEGTLLYRVYSPELVNAQEEFIAALKSNNRFLLQASQSKLQSLGVAQRFINELKQAKKIYQDVPVYTPQSGYVGELNLRKGMFINPSIKLMNIGSLDQVWVIAEVFERQAHLINQGDLVEMSLDYLPAKAWSGQVDYIYPVLDKNTRTLQVRIRFDNPDLLLKPDMFASVTILSRPTEPVLSVPSSSVIVTGTQERVVVSLGEGRYKSVEVKAGGRFVDRTAIFEGLYPDDRVVTSAQFLLDSESTLSSDFSRMTPSSMGSIESVWVMAEIQNIDPQKRTLTLAHKAIREWEQPAMTMEVPLAEELDMSPFREGDSIQVLLKGGNMGNLKLIDFVVPRPKAPNSSVGGAL